MSRKLVVCGLVLVGLMMLSVCGCAKKVSKANYEKIANDMTLAEVENILGKGEMQAGASGGLGDIMGKGEVYKWVDGDKTITVTFVNDKVTMKAQTGL